MKKLFVFALLPAILLWSLWGCSSPKEEPEETKTGEQRVETQASAIPEAPVIPEEYLYLAGEHVFLEYCQHRNNSIELWLLSGSPLQLDDVEAVLAEGVPLEYSFSDEVSSDWDPVMPLYIYQILRGKDWKSLRELEDDCQKEYMTFEGADMTKELAAAQNEFREDYEALRQQNKLPSLYGYRLHIYLPEAGFSTPEGIKELTVRVKGEDRTFPVGEIKYAETDYVFSYEEPVFYPCRGIGWRITEPAADGIFTESDGLNVCRLRAEEDITIRDIRLQEDTREISDIQIIILNSTEGGAVYDENGEEIHDIIADYMWDGITPIAVAAGQEVAINFRFHEPRLANTLCGYTRYDLEIAYDHADGTQAVTSCQFPVLLYQIGATHYPFEIYLQYALGLDPLSYYTDYRNMGINIFDPWEG